MNGQAIVGFDQADKVWQADDWLLQNWRQVEQSGKQEKIW